MAEEFGFEPDSGIDFIPDGGRIDFVPDGKPSAFRRGIDTAKETLKAISKPLQLGVRAGELAAKTPIPGAKRLSELIDKQVEDKPSDKTLFQQALGQASFPARAMAKAPFKLAALSIPQTVGDVGLMAAGPAFAGIMRTGQAAKGGFKLAQTLSPKSQEALKKFSLKTEEAVLRGRAAPVSEIPIAARPEAAIAPQTGRPVLNLNRFESELAGDVAEELAKDQKTIDALMAQRRGVVPLAKSREAGENLVSSGKASAEEFALLQPGQSIKAGTPDAKMAAARIISEESLKELAALGNAPLTDDAINKGATLFRAFIGSEGVISEGGRALGAVRKTTQQKALARAAQIAMREGIQENPQKFKEFLQQISSIPEDSVRQRILVAKKFLEQGNPIVAAIRELRGAMLLTNPVTFLRNTIGNTAAVISNLIEKPVSGVVDLARAAITGGPRERFVGEAGANAIGMWRSIGDSASNAVRSLLSESSATGLSEFAIQPAIPGAVGRAIRLPFRILQSTDEFFKGVLISGELRAQAFRKAAQQGLKGQARLDAMEAAAKKPTEEMIDSALKVAKEFTFQKNLGDFAGPISKALNSDWGLPARIIVPFFKTPVNIAKFGIERSPLGLTQLPFRRGGEFSDKAAKAMVGTGALVSAALTLKYNEGLFTGRGPKDKKERDLLFQTGWRPYSIKIGDSYVGFQSFEPISAYLRVVADYAEKAKALPEATRTELAGKAVYEAARGFLDQPFLKSIGDIFKAWDELEGEKFGRVIKGVASSFIPSGVAAIARQQDPVLRQPDTVIEAIKTRIPGLSQQVRPKLDIFGREVKRTGRALGLIDTPPSADPVAKRLLQLGLQKEVPLPPNKIAGRNLTKDEINKFTSGSGKIIYDKLSILFSAPGFDDIPDEMKRSFIRKIVESAREGERESIRVPVELRELGIQTNLTPTEAQIIKMVTGLDAYKKLTDQEKKAILTQTLFKIRGNQ